MDAFVPCVLGPLCCPLFHTSTGRVLHLSNGSQDPAFRADVAAKESNQDRALGLLLMVIRFGLLLWVGMDWERAWHTTDAEPVEQEWYDRAFH